jgi:uncharacterized membrane protein
MNKIAWQSLLAGVPLRVERVATDGGISRFWRQNLGGYIFWFAVLAAVVALAYYVITKIRPEPEKMEPLASQWLSKYREMHSRGELSDEEFRTIKTKLAEQLQDELNDNGETG